MDQVKQALKAMNKHRFWIGYIAVLAVAVGCWFKSTSDLQAAAKKDTDTIKGAFSAVEGGGPRVAGPGRFDKAKAADNHVMVWADASQADLQKQVDWPNRPSTKRVRLMQEDIWVYESLCKAIAATNTGARGSWEARV